MTVDDCERVSREVSDLLDVADVINGQYTLEVSSPGLDRILFKPEHYEANVGHQVEVHLNQSFEGKRRLSGLLKGLEDGELVVQSGDEEYVLPLPSVQRTRLVPSFD